MLLDIATYARPGVARRDRLSPAEIGLISRTVRRSPEVMVKVLTHGGHDLKSVQRHLAYLNRKGELEIETDEEERIAGKGVEKELLEDWDLDLEADRRRVDLGPLKDRSPPKLVHKILFSMPAGTPPQKVLEAVKDFAREGFALQHRYALVLHTDEPHPHVHMVVKAVSEQGVRLNIRKATLREWRREFARHLREQGIEANATERAVRGQNRASQKDAIYRADQRGASTYIHNRAERLRKEKVTKAQANNPGIGRLARTRAQVQEGWYAASVYLRAIGMSDLAKEVQEFGTSLPPVRIVDDGMRPDPLREFRERPPQQLARTR
jgi:hypothetical protein